ncbi:hypothetical protein JHK87_055752 [Glycine soja]|nr:hypothetical protein JHK87_055752 [Glycine soja]
MAHFEKDEVPMLSKTHAQLSDEVVDSNFRRLVSRTRSASISIPMASLESYEKETSLNIVATRTKVVESKTEKFSTFNGTDENRWDNDYNRKNEHLMRSGQLGMCNDPYCTTCPTYFKASQPRTWRTSAIFDPKIMISFVLRKYLGISGANFAKHLLRAAILLQYFPRLFSDRASDQSKWWNKNVNATACLDSSSGAFPYGIYVHVVPLTIETRVVKKYVFALFWGFQGPHIK